MPNHKKPTAMKKLQGTFRKDRATEGEPDPQEITRLPEPPEYLNDYGHEEWSRLFPILQKNKVLTEMDLQSLELLCGAYGEYRELHDAVYTTINPETRRKRKRTLTEYLADDGSGKPRNTQTQIEYSNMHKALALYKSLLSEFGLTPASRTKVATTKEPDQQDDFQKFLSKYGS